MVPGHGPVAAVVVSALLLTAGAAQAASPGLGGIYPRGGQRGTALTIQFRGSRLADAQEVLVYAPGPAERPWFEVLELDAKGDRVDARVRIAADCPLGEHAMRVRTATGITELRTFWVGQFPDVAESEPNSDFDKAQTIDLNVTVTGVVENEDVDYYVVAARKGQRVTAEIEAVRLGLTLFDAYVAIQDMGRYELSASDDTALLLQDAIAAIVAPEDGRYVIQVRESAYAGNGNCRYRLHVGSCPRPLALYPAGGPAGAQVTVRFLGDPLGDFEQTIQLPDAPDPDHRIFARQGDQDAPSPNRFRVSAFANVLESEPNNAAESATATDADLPLAFNGIVAEAGDVDWFRFNGRKGGRYHVRVHARSVRSPLDSVLSLHDVQGRQLAANDDAGGPDSAFDFNIPADGPYLIQVRDHLQKGGPTYVYRVEFTPIAPSLSVSIPRFGRDSQARRTVSVPRGNRTASLFNASRGNFSGDLVFEAVDLPEGIVLHGQTMPSNIRQMPFVFEAAADAPVAGRLADVVARHADASQDIRGGCRQDVELVRGAPNNTVYYGIGVDRLPVAVTEAVPFSVDIVPPTVPLVQNGSMDLKIVAERRDGFDGPINVRMLWNPPGIGSKSTVTIPKGADAVLYPINANGKAATRTWQIAVLGEADAGGGQVLVASRLTALTVAPPYVEMAIEMAALERGQSGEVVCRLTYRKPFEGAAAIQLLGLPAQVSAEPMQVNAGEAEIVFPVQTADATPCGKHKSLFCRLIVTEQDAPIVHNVGHGGVLRVDPPPPPRKDEPAPAPRPKPKEQKKPKPKPEKRLTRLEQLRLQAEERARATAGGQ